MKPTWYRAEISAGGGDQKAGTATWFLKYDLRCWTVGVRFDVDPSWYSFYLDLGPFEIELCYWRRYVYLLD